MVKQPAAVTGVYRREKDVLLDRRDVILRPCMTSLIAFKARNACGKAGIPRRRHGHGHGRRLAKHGYSLTSDIRYFLARILADTSATRDFLKLFPWQAERHAEILATILARMSARMSVSASWNAS